MRLGLLHGREAGRALGAVIAAFALALGLGLCACSAGGGASADGASGQAAEQAQSADDGQELDVASFSWSGGSGRLKGMSCTKLVERDGQAFATVELESAHYEKMRVDGAEYDDLTPGQDMSTFEVPVNLNANTQVSGLTTAMSQPHWVDYTLYVATSDGAGAQGSQGEDGAGAAGLDEEAPAVMGFTAEGAVDTGQARYFKMFRYDQGVTLVEIDARTGSGADGSSAGDGASDDSDGGSGASSGAGASDTAAAAGASNGSAADEENDAPIASLYEGGVLRYLVVPAGVEVPAGTEKRFIVVQQPVESAAVMAPQALPLVAQAGAAQEVAAVADGMEDAAANAGATGAQTAGQASDLDFRAIVSAQCDLIVEDGSAVLADRDGQKLLATYGKRAATLGIALVPDRSQDEEGADARAAWAALYGALFGSADAEGAGA